MPVSRNARRPPTTLLKVAKALTALLILKTIVWVGLTLPSYFTPDFQSDFLRGREAYFFGVYRWAFYPHVIGGPLSLGVGLVLLSDSARRRWPQWHRRLGRLQVANVLLIVAPTGLWMAFYAATGATAGVGLACLAVATATTVLLGWRAAVRRHLTSHRRWMLRCYVLLCSAVTLRVVGGVAKAFEVDGVYPYSAWLSWLVPLAVTEIALRPTWLEDLRLRPPSTAPPTSRQGSLS